MPTSATGADRRKAEAGFTLVELMVVLVVVGLISAAVLLTMPSGANVSREAEALGARLVRAKEEAILTNRSIAVSVGSDGYAFLARTRTGWSPLVEGPFKPVRWGEGVVASAQPAGEVRFESTGQAEPISVVLVRQSRRARVSVDAAGNVRIDGAA